MLNGSYSNNEGYATTNAETPPIDLSTSTEPVLSFWGWAQTEGTYDGFNVKISTDGGTVFNVVASVVPALQRHNRRPDRVERRQQLR